MSDVTCLSEFHLQFRPFLLARLGGMHARIFLCGD